MGRPPIAGRGVRILCMDGGGLKVPPSCRGCLLVNSWPCSRRGRCTCRDLQQAPSIQAVTDKLQTAHIALSDAAQMQPVARQLSLLSLCDGKEVRGSGRACCGGRGWLRCACCGSCRTAQGGRCMR